MFCLLFNPLCLRTMGLSPESSVVAMADFLHAVGDLKLRGTSQIFRSSTSIIQYLQELQYVLFLNNQFHIYLIIMYLKGSRN